MSLWKLIAARYGAGATEFDDVRIDGSTNALNCISYPHHEIHAGDAFVAHYENMVTNTGEMTVIGFNTPDTARWAHVFFLGSSTSITRFSIVEAPSIDADEGTQLLIYNRNRNSLTESGLLSIEAVPVTNRATSYNEVQAAGASITQTNQLNSIIFGTAGAGGSSRGSGGSAATRLEFILRQNTQYALIGEALDDSDNHMTIEMEWYEHQDVH